MLLFNMAMMPLWIDRLQLESSLASCLAPWTWGWTRRVARLVAGFVRCLAKFFLLE